MVQVGSLLSEEKKNQLLEFLRCNTDIFACSASDMPSILLEFITHKLNINPIFKLIWYKKRNFTSKRQKTIDEEVSKLLAAKFIQEAHYPNWLVNIIIVKNANRKWRIYIEANRKNHSWVPWRCCPRGYCGGSNNLTLLSLARMMGESLDAVPWSGWWSSCCNKGALPGMVISQQLFSVVHPRG